MFGWVHVSVCYLMKLCVFMCFVCPTIEIEWFGESQNSNVPAVVIDVRIYEGQVAAVVNDGLHLRHVGVDWFVVNGAQQHTPAVNKAVPSGMESVTGRSSNVLEGFLNVNTDTQTCHFNQGWSRHSFTRTI